MNNGDNETIRALKAALREADCPESCYNGGIYLNLGHGDFDLERCLFCATRDELIGEPE